MPAFWKNDYSQIEIVPAENKAFILKQAGQIDDLSQRSRTGFGFTATFERSPMSTKTLSKEIGVDYLEKTLLSFQFKKAKHIRYGKNEILNCVTGKTKAFVF